MEQSNRVSSPQKLYRHPKTTFVADFIGMPRINLIKLTSTSTNSTFYCNGDISIDLGWLPGVSEIIVGARPEDIILSGDRDAPGEQYKITAILPNGPETIVQLVRGNTAILARVGHETAFKASDTVLVDYACLSTYTTQNQFIDSKGITIAAAKLKAVKT